MSNPKSNKFYILLSTLPAIGGIYFVGLAGDYLWDYIKDSSANPNRDEYLQGMMLSLLLALPFWMLVAYFAAPLRKAVSKVTFRIIIAPALILGTAFILLNLMIMIMMLLDVTAR